MSPVLVRHTSQDRTPRGDRGSRAPAAAAAACSSSLAHPRAPQGPRCSAAAPPAFGGSGAEWRHRVEPFGSGGGAPASAGLLSRILSSLIPVGSARGPRSSESPVSVSAPSSSSPLRRASQAAARWASTVPWAPAAGARPPAWSLCFPRRFLSFSSRLGVSAPACVAWLSLHPGQPWKETFTSC